MDKIIKIWNFCNNYIEIVKHRLYRPEEFGEKARYSGQKTVYMILYKLLQDFSIYFPFITEEIYQELYHDNKSIHLTTIKSFDYNFEEEIKYGDLICEIISQVRGEKSNNNMSLKTVVSLLKISTEENLKKAIREAENDFKATLLVDELDTSSNIESGFEIKKIKLEG